MPIYKILIVITILLAGVPQPGYSGDIQGTGFLDSFTCTSLVVEDTGQDGEQLFITSEHLHDALFVALKKQLPKLTVEDTCPDHVYLSVTVRPIISVGGRSLAVAAFIILSVKRQARMMTTDKMGYATAWYVGKLLSAPKEGIKAFVFGVLDEEITNFAAVYYKAGNP